MLRKFLAVVGVVTVLAPERIVDTAERYVSESPDDCDLKPWVLPAARAEGLTYVLIAWRGETLYSVFKRSLGVMGLPALLAPRASVDAATRVAYEDPEGCQWKPWVYPVGRVVGGVFVLVALDAIRRD